MKPERIIQTINIFISSTKLNEDDSASTSQIDYLKKLCKNKDIEFPFCSMKDAKSHFRKTEASRALKELLERGNLIEFIYPYTED